MSEGESWTDILWYVAIFLLIAAAFAACFWFVDLPDPRRGGFTLNDLKCLCLTGFFCVVMTGFIVLAIRTYFGTDISKVGPDSGTPESA